MNVNERLTDESKYRDYSNASTPFPEMTAVPSDPPSRRGRQDPREEATQAVLRCHAIHGNLGEDCLREELTEKRCYARVFCPYEARRFYDDPIPVADSSPRRGVFSGFFSPSSEANKTISIARPACSTVVERFAFPENDLRIPEGTSVHKECRSIVYELAKCMSRQKVGSVRLAH